MQHDPRPQAQANKHQWSLISGLEAARGRPVCLLSTLLISDFPRNPRIFVSKRKWCHCADSNDLILGFINILILKHITRFTSALTAVIRWQRQCPRGTRKVLIVYSLISSHLWAALLARWLARDIRVVNIVTDPPSELLPDDGQVRRCLRMFDRWLIKLAMRKMDGLVVLAKNIATDFAPSIPYILMEGIISKKDCEELVSRCSGGDGEGGGRKESNRSKRFRIMFCGGLTERNGLGLLLDAFALLEENRFELWVFGKGEMAGKVRMAAEVKSSVKYGGFVSQEVIRDMLSEADILVNPRGSGQDFNRYSFPSKLMEYMASGCPVISTILPSLPEDYYQYLMLLKEETPIALAAMIERVSRMPIGERRLFGAQAREFVLREKDYRVQGGRLGGFLEEVIGAGQ